jgi:hypothetical protein
MSGYTNPGEVADMIAAGFDQHVAKPIADFDTFRDLLASLARPTESVAGPFAPSALVPCRTYAPNCRPPHPKPVS